VHQSTKSALDSAVEISFAVIKIILKQTITKCGSMLMALPVVAWSVYMVKIKNYKTLRISNHMVDELRLYQRQRFKQLAQEYALDAGIDWDLEYRWMTISDYNFMLAKLKYNDILT